jgi:hypothetical protein
MYTTPPGVDAELSDTLLHSAGDSFGAVRLAEGCVQESEAERYYTPGSDLTKKKHYTYKVQHEHFENPHSFFLVNFGF